MIAFITYVKKENNGVFGGCLCTDKEFSPLEFIYTEEIRPWSSLEKILYGTNFDMKWFGDVIAGTLYNGIKDSEVAKDEKLEAIIVSDSRMLFLRRNTENIPVVYIDKNENINTFEDYERDEEIIKNLIPKINFVNVQEIFSRIVKGIVEIQKNI